jgi:hypothetical protein
MTAPAVEIVAPADAMNDAMAAATADGLPPDAIVRIVARASPAADIVAEVHWSDEERQHARLVVRTKDGRTAERTLDFGPGDPARERGRTLGFAVAAMIPEELRLEAPTSDREPSRVSPPSAPAEPGPPRALRSTEHDRPREDRGLRSALWLDASAQGGVGVGGNATGLGGALAARVPFEHVALRIGGAIRGGSVDEADASSALFRADAGIAFYTVIVDPRLVVGARTGLLVLHHSLGRSEPAGLRTTDTHTLLGAEGLLEGSIALSARFAVVLATGAEVAFGQTRIIVGDTRVAVLPPVRVISELGARVAF